MTVVYPYPDLVPILFASVEDSLTRKRLFCRMLIDTGACHTGFPEKYAAVLGHDNLHKDVKHHITETAGGPVKCYLHSVRVGLIDPHCDPKRESSGEVVWQSKKEKTSFIEKLDSGFGIIGMDVISEWEALVIIPKSKGGEIRISI